MDTAYLLDQDDCIVGVSGPWLEFSDENGGVGLDLESIIGKPIWHFVAGDDTKMWLSAILMHVRLKGEPIERSYRCDSPELKRFMKMTIHPGEHGALTVSHQLISTEEPPVAVFIKPGSGAKTLPTDLRCSICGKIKSKGEWHEPSDLVRDHNEFTVVYTVCEHCRRDGLQKALQEAAKRSLVP